MDGWVDGKRGEREIERREGAVKKTFEWNFIKYGLPQTDVVHRCQVMNVIITKKLKREIEEGFIVGGVKRKD